jgi:hypothetical protein
MKKILFLSMVLAFSATVVSAQIKTPSPSPGAKIEQTIGLVDVTVEYSRPGVKGRTVFGDLVPYDKVWRTGANAATKITFSGDANFGGSDVKAGSYALLTKPGMKEWAFMLYPYESGNWGSYLESDVEPIMVTAASWQMAGEMSVETFMMAFDNITDTKGDLYLLWDRTGVSVPITVNTAEAVEASIKSVMDGPSANDYYAAGTYYFNAKKDNKQALEWVNMAIDKGYDRFWVQRQKSLIQAAMGDKKGAIASAKKSLEMAKEAGNDEYIKMNNESIMEWSK